MNRSTMPKAFRFDRWPSLYVAAAVGSLAAVSVAIAPASSSSTSSSSSSSSSLPSVPPDGLYCSDRYGNRVQDGVEYMPEDDPCKKCQCHMGFPVMCRSVQCSPPVACEHYESLKNECCVYRCLQSSLDIYRNYGNGSNYIYPMHKDINSVNLSIRLVASAVTSLLIIALLIFMIHRLRQRRLLIAMRRLNNERRSVNESLAYMTNIDQLDVRFEFPPYEDPPPPYSPPKPLHDFPNDDPPPYESTSPIPLDAEDHDRNGSVRGTVSGQHLPFSVMGVRKSGNTAWAWKHLLRRCSAEEYCDSELLELTQLNHNSKSALAVSSPVLSRCRRSPNNCLPHSCTVSDSNCGALETHNFNLEFCSTEESCLPFVHQDSDQLLVNQLHLNSSASQLLHHSASHLSPLKSSIELDNVELGKQQKQNKNNQNSFCHSDVLWSSPLKENAEYPKRFETSFDSIDNRLGSLSADPEEGNYPNKTRVKQLSNCTTMAANSGMIQKSTPEVSLCLKQFHLSCSEPSKEEALQGFGGTKSALSKSKPSFFSGSLLNKKNQNLRPLSCIEPISDSTNNNYISRMNSLQVLSQTDENYKAIVNSRNAEKHEVISAPDHQFTNPSLYSCSLGSGRVQTCKTRAEAKVSEDTRDVVDYASVEMKRLVKKDLTEQNDRSNDASCVQFMSPSNGCVLTPESPLYQQFLRSESVTSEASFFSICSETGENKHTRNMLASTRLTTTPQNSVPKTAFSQQSNGSWIGSVKHPGTELSYFPAETTALGLAATVATEALKHNSSSNWIFKQQHFSGKNHCTLPGKKKQRKRSFDYPNTLHESWSILQSKNSKEKSCQKLFEGHNFDGQSHHAQYYEQNKGNNLEKNSEMKQFNSSGGLWNSTSYNCLNGAKTLCDDTECPTYNELVTESKKSLGSSHDRYSCNKCKEQTNTGHNHKSKQLESFEHLVSRILQQLETAYFDDFGISMATVQKNHRPKSCGNRSSPHSTDHLCVPGKGTSKQKLRPISLPGARNRFLSDEIVKSKLAALDVANKNRCKADICEMMNVNKCRQILCSNGGQVCNCFEECAEL